MGAEPAMTAAPTASSRSDVADDAAGTAEQHEAALLPVIAGDGLQSASDGGARVTGAPCTRTAPSGWSACEDRPSRHATSPPSSR
jgi:hypothetical protein